MWAPWPCLPGQAGHHGTITRAMWAPWPPSPGQARHHGTLTRAMWAPRHPYPGNQGTLTRAMWASWPPSPGQCRHHGHPYPGNQGTLTRAMWAPWSPSPGQCRHHRISWQGNLRLACRVTMAKHRGTKQRPSTIQPDILGLGEPGMPRHQKHRDIIKESNNIKEHDNQEGNRSGNMQFLFREANRVKPPIRPKNVPKSDTEHSHNIQMLLVTLSTHLDKVGPGVPEWPKS